MTQLKHTPGPWYGFEDKGVFADEDQKRPVFETGCGCCTGNELSQANACLISAAPDLLEALEAYLSLETHIKDGMSPIIDLGRAALKKARGE